MIKARDPFAFLVILVVFMYPAAKADSDGYFCSSKNFLAYEFSYSKAPFDKHKLYVYRFGSDATNEPEWIEIPEFQLHAMRCYEDRVEMAGWENHYVYEVTSSAVIPASEKTLETPGRKPDNLSSNIGNIGMISPVVRGTMPEFHVFELWPDSPSGRHEIRVKRVKVDKPCEAKVESTLVKLGESGNEEALQILFSDNVSIECG